MTTTTILRQGLAIIFICTLAYSTSQAQLISYPNPGIVIQGQTITSGTYMYSHPGTITSPSDPGLPVEISNSAHVTFESANEVKLKDGFHAGGFNSTGQFLGRINDNLEMVLVTTDPATSIVNGMLHVPKWEKLEIALKLPQEYQAAIDRFFINYWTAQGPDPDTDLNPYAFDSLEVLINLTAPSGRQLTKWAFYMKPGRFPSNIDHSYPEFDDTNEYKDYPFRLRFAPDELSNGIPWTFSITISNPQNLSGFPTYTYPGLTFICDNALSDNHGYLKRSVTNAKLLQFGDETPFFAIGLNMADVRKNFPPNNFDYHWALMQKHDFDLFLGSVEKLGSAGGNYIRSWFYKFTFAPEWEHLGVYDAFSNTVNACPDGSGWDGNREGNRQWSCWMFDELLNKCRENNVYVQLCVDPSYPGVAYQKFQWGDHIYVRNYVYPTGTWSNYGYYNGPYDASEFFVSSNVMDRENEGVMYYWKRKYKYILSRWGYSTNIADFETFNEIDGALGYEDKHTGSFAGSNDVNKFPIPNFDPEHHMCDNNQVQYFEDAAVKNTISEWHDYMLPYAQGLDDNNHLFSISYTHLNRVDLTYNDLLDHPLLDFNDIHSYHNDFTSQEDRSWIVQSLLNVEEKPAILGECSTFGDRTMSDGTTSISTFKYYENHDISFHNEIWGTAMNGSFGTGLSWFWETVFWWEYAMPDNYKYEINGNMTQFNILNNIDDINQVFINPFIFPFKNSTGYHQYKPLSEFMQSINLDTPTNSFKFVDVPQSIRSYSQIQQDGMAGYGWIHNYNSFWKNKWIIDDDNNNFMGCTPSPAAEFIIDGLIPGEIYAVNYYNTRMNGQILPSTFYGTAQNCSTSSGCLTVLLDFTLGCDTIDSDYAFKVDYLGPLRLMGNGTITQEPTFHIEVNPNPSNSGINIYSSIKANYNCQLIDISGKGIFSFHFDDNYYKVEKSLKPGVYTLRIYSNSDLKVVKIVIQ